MVEFSNLGKEHLSLIINGFFTLLGVIIGALITYMLNSMGSIKLFLNRNDIDYIETSKNKIGQYSEKSVTFDQSNKIKISLNLDFYNSSSSSKSIRDLKISNGNDTKNIYDITTTRLLSDRQVMEKIKNINFRPKEMIEIQCEIILDKEFFENNENTNIYFSYKIGKGDRDHQLLIYPL